MSSADLFSKVRGSSPDNHQKPRTCQTGPRHSYSLVSGGAGPGFSVVEACISHLESCALPRAASETLISLPQTADNRCGVVWGALRGGPEHGPRETGYGARSPRRAPWGSFLFARHSSLVTPHCFPRVWGTARGARGSKRGPTFQGPRFFPRPTKPRTYRTGPRYPAGRRGGRCLPSIRNP